MGLPYLGQGIQLLAELDIFLDGKVSQSTCLSFDDWQCRCNQALSIFAVTDSEPCCVGCNA